MKKDKNLLKKESLKYHKKKPKGKIEINPTKRADTQNDLSLAYSPGVAYPCLEIEKNPNEAYNYTNKGNLIAVISNGSAVLGLGNIGALAGKPVMEGKAVLFKKFANIDVFDIEIKTQDPKEFVEIVSNLEPTFGGINLEDIKSPDCFFIEEELKKRLTIPVFHDDQHGTAIISGAALINACYLQNKNLKDVKVVFNGAGAAALSCATHFEKLGIKKEHIFMCDSQGLIYKGREKNMNEFKEQFAVESSAKTLEDVLEGADVFCGLSVGNVLNEKMLKSMAEKPIVFALANPDPEVDPQLAKKIRPDVIIATGRSDYPNQVNNVLGFPAIFRGALDVQAVQINDEMKMAATKALADLARKEVPESVSSAYDDKVISFGPDYIIPKPFDSRVLIEVTPEICKAAIKSKVAREDIKDFNSYKKELESYLGFSKSFLRDAITSIRSHPEKIPTILFPEGTSLRILKAINSLYKEKICNPVVLGDKKQITTLIKKHQLEYLDQLNIIDLNTFKDIDKYAKKLCELRSHKNLSFNEAKKLVTNPYYFSALSVELSESDSLISGTQSSYSDCVKPILEIIKSDPDNEVFGLSVLFQKNKIFFFADTTLNINPSAKQLACFAIQTSEVLKMFKMDPQICMLSFTNMNGTSQTASKMREAVKLVNERKKDLPIDGEFQADLAVNYNIMKHIASNSKLKQAANILIFPNLDSANISYKLVQQLGQSDLIGPFLIGTKKPIHIVQRTGRTQEIINSIIMTCYRTQKHLLEK